MASSSVSSVTIAAYPPCSPKVRDTRLTCRKGRAAKAKRRPVPTVNRCARSFRRVVARWRHDRMSSSIASGLRGPGDDASHIVAEGCRPKSCRRFGRTRCGASCSHQRSSDIRDGHTCDASHVTPYVAPGSQSARFDRHRELRRHRSPLFNRRVAALLVEFVGVSVGACLSSDMTGQFTTPTFEHVNTLIPGIRQQIRFTGYKLGE